MRTKRITLATVPFNSDIEKIKEAMGYDIAVQERDLNLVEDLEKLTEKGSVLICSSLYYPKNGVAIKLIARKLNARFVKMEVTECI